MMTATTETPALLRSHEGCFACGITSPNGLRLHFDVGQDGIARAEWVPSDDFRSYPDRVHGGVIATLIDSAIVHALFAQGVAGVTAELNLRFLERANPRDPLSIIGRVDAVKHGVYFCSAEADQNGQLVARASAKFMPMAGS